MKLNLIAQYELSFTDLNNAYVSDEDDEIISNKLLQGEYKINFFEKFVYNANDPDTPLYKVDIDLMSVFDFGFVTY
jgi:hypothetical protein